ncbi:MAG: aminomethyl transferase family protein [Gemmatimonadetes bacterium]|uniref:Aminomethyl transferase family protein n=1 Tax=Candidatus Kutchimonas denitrificans TaxID=3056748 RepID=A0AAE4Z5T5_9BACT|nr:aminomethyl transferase family protein [Gemmatimonadota bacterium]NIR74108.1 aminomethyl transferase family protein [Candidatus Kutchimonas denitrificans]NIS01290.1 aminomethyl transferase family protein [Gemmatimonadota bacterium]NIT67021.1 aminomethyl transferase family protein [Gemmatimonadota bacterium]NIU51681.1 hypothetical protein [Gemmatimonadota bacterium]
MTDVLRDTLSGPSEPGDVEAQYRALIDACGLTLRRDRRFVRIRGDRRAEMLNGLVTNEVLGLADAGRHAMLLTAKGRVLTDMRVFPEADALLLEVPDAGLTNLLATFKRYLPPIYATFENVSESLAQIGLYGPQAAAAAVELTGGEPPAGTHGCREMDLDGGPALIVRERRLPVDGIELTVLSAGLGVLAERALAACEALGGRPAGLEALDVLRVEAGLPAYGRDMDERVLAQETGLEDAISHDKGCYLGQEVVARIHFRGHVNRTLRGLEFDDETADAGAALRDDDKQVGQVTSSVESPDLGPIGLGYVRREVEPGARLGWSAGDREGEATVRALPFRLGDL